MPEIVTLSALFEDELRDVYDAENQIVRALPKLIDAVSADQLRAALETHLEETRNHEIVDLTYIAAMSNAWNRLATALRSVPGRYRAARTNGTAAATV